MSKPGVASCVQDVFIVQKLEKDKKYAKKIQDAMIGSGVREHKPADKILCALLSELGYLQTVEAYEKDAENFWVSPPSVSPPSVFMKYIYAGRVYYGTGSFSADDNCWHGRIEGIKDLITFEAETSDGLVGAFEEAVERGDEDFETGLKRAMENTLNFYRLLREGEKEDIV